MSDSSYTQTAKMIRTNLINHNHLSPIYLPRLQFSYQNLHRAVFSVLHLNRTVFIRSNLRGAFLLQSH